MIEKSQVERDLGLLVSTDIKWATQVEKATKAAKAIIAQIRNSFSYFDAGLVKLLYVSLETQYFNLKIKTCKITFNFFLIVGTIFLGKSRPYFFW